MKKIFASLVVMIVLVASSFAQTEGSKYHQAMSGALAQIGKCKTATDFMNVSNTFERISQAENKRWTPAYYAIYTKAISSFVEQDEDKREQTVDGAQELMNGLKEKYPDNSEIMALQGFLYQAKLSIKPASRGMFYGPKAERALEKAIELDENNPRAHYLLGRNLKNTPAFFGGGKTKALKEFKLAESAYEKESGIEPNVPFAPRWGKSQNKKEMEKITEKQ
ncbi:hypothetical protein FUAX_17720 [Fulvitalea axinellae]|uniref:Tetratricopeptide repeat protein n=1 Tax=Fulvitalea axinellae TaxID=1182444 RepID=A0AAU9DEI0_9BACT|nr:hypothetical protein FUAX_17720 [Fulvitalea axinellae]